MGGVYFVGAEYAAGGNHADGQLAFFHHPCLDWGGLGAEHDFLVNIKSILLVFGGMVRRDVQLFKIIEIVLHFRPFHNLIAHADENPLHFL